MEPFESAILPVLPLREGVIFPGTLAPLVITRPGGAAALKAALRGDKRLFVVCQADALVEHPDAEDLHEVGSVAEVVQTVPLEDGTTKILLEGLYVARRVDLINSGDHHRALLVREKYQDMDSVAQQASTRATIALFERYVELTRRVPEELVQTIKELADPGALVHSVAHYCMLKAEDKQGILQAQSLEEKFHLLNSVLEEENQALMLEGHIIQQVQSRIGRSQREAFLNEQLKAIERELGMDDEDGGDISELRAAVEAAQMSEEAHSRAMKEIGRLGKMPPLSPEATVVRSYVETLTELPWHYRTDEQRELLYANLELGRKHFGLDKVKERILEHLSVLMLSGRTRGPILCLVGPPGVGKTSLAQQVARAMGRRFARISLGGVRDEAEIRGHRRTYVGAMPGKIIQSMRKAGSVNPVILLDEIDKMSSDFRGDPAAALLEVLDPEQNARFADHYLEVEYDLSNVLFLCTANTSQGIPAPLLDRMEVLRLSGYTDREKLIIAKQHLIPKAFEANGLDSRLYRFRKAAIERIIHGYTREAGVRNLEREINSVMRKLAMKLVQEDRSLETEHGNTLISAELVRELLGPPKFREAAPERRPELGVVVGLAWTEVGGELLHVESRFMPGKGKLTLTGTLGDVMKESAHTALSYIRSRAAELGIPEDFHEKMDLHIHLPEGAIPKDGPSAGIALAASLASLLSGRPARQDIAMTGELTLRGKVLKIGGLKEKVLAAHRYKLRAVILPEENVPELEQVPKDVREKLTFHPVETLDEVLRLVMPDNAEPQKRTASKKSKRRSKASDQPRA